MWLDHKPLLLNGFAGLGSLKYARCAYTESYNAPAQNRDWPREKVPMLAQIFEGRIFRGYHLSIFFSRITGLILCKISRTKFS